MATLSTTENPEREIINVLNHFEQAFADRKMINRLANTFFYAPRKQKLLFVVGEIFEYGFEKFPTAYSQECVDFIINLIGDDDRLKGDTTDSPLFSKRIRNTRQLIASEEIQGYEYLEALL
jgi:hypothetical protein